MADEETKKKESPKEEPTSTSSCCSFSNTEAFLKKVLGESELEQPNPATDISCGCGCETHSSAEPTSTVQDPT